MKTTLILVALVSMTLAAPHRNYYRVPTYGLRTEIGERLVCDYRLCYLTNIYDIPRIRIPVYDTLTPHLYPSVFTSEKPNKKTDETLEHDNDQTPIEVSSEKNEGDDQHITNDDTVSTENVSEHGVPEHVEHEHVEDDEPEKLKREKRDNDDCDDDDGDDDDDDKDDVDNDDDNHEDDEDDVDDDDDYDYSYGDGNHDGDGEVVPI